MKILIDSKSARDGFIAVLQLLGHDVEIYDRWKKSPFDAFDEWTPNIYIDTEAGMGNRSIVKCLKEYKKTRPFSVAKDYCAADTLITKHAVAENVLKTDVVFIGNHTDENAKYILPLSGHTKFKLKVFGRGWEIPESLGKLTAHRAENALRSAKIALHITEPTSTQYFYQILISGTLCLSTPGTPYTHNVSQFDSAKQLIHSIDTLINHDKGWEAMSRAAKSEILSSQTYFHVVSDMFEQLEMKTEAERVMKQYANQRL